ncbi:hypothetical protein BV25DRAFT_1921449 [Artomyces pyxidatus]|uniref:Uncharacterized protein n=2 Tax=Artomyces pyxidatus TaxID=48021 RepID=A0ACB8SI43_9AGAM|nr:hypothetical protein BV25DRAFT_1921449 [Artomyces pyxidatus]
MSLLIVDDVAWLWWYDRQGAIQSTGVDIVKDLPRFLVLLLAMQRFSSEDWGVNPTLGGAHPDPIEPGSALPAGPVALANNDGQVITLQLIEDILLRVRLRGRATRVIRALSPSPHPFTMVSLEGRPLVVKLSSPEEQRESEVKVLQAAQKAAMANADIDGHIPEVIFACDLGYSTGTIRDELGELWLAPDAAVPACLRTIFRPARLLRLIVFEELEPIVSRSGRDFLTAWVECVKCHYALWAAGVEHSDPSLDNLMVRVTRAPDGAEAVSGVMNDWDLANLRGISQHTGLERTGTLPFQALELLTDEYWRGEVERLYRHDLEALIWVLPWVFLRMKGERTVKNPPLEAWQTSKYRTCYVKKLVFLGDMPDYSASPSWKIEWRWGGQLLRWLKLEKTRREYLATDFDAWNGGQLAKEQDNWDAEYQKFWKVYKYAATRASLDYLVALIPSGIQV